MKRKHFVSLISAGTALSLLFVPVHASAEPAFVGLQYEARSGLLHNRARSYDPEVGLFTSRDPAGISGGTNVYQYCLGNPVNMVDPTGQNPAIIVVAGIVAYLLLNNPEVANAPGPGDPVYNAKGPVPMVDGIEVARILHGARDIEVEFSRG